MAGDGRRISIGTWRYLTRRRRRRRYGSLKVSGLGQPPALPRSGHLPRPSAPLDLGGLACCADGGMRHCCRSPSLGDETLGAPALSSPAPLCAGERGGGGHRGRGTKAMERCGDIVAIERPGWLAGWLTTNSAGELQCPVFHSSGTRVSDSMAGRLGQARAGPSTALFGRRAK